MSKPLMKADDEVLRISRANMVPFSTAMRRALQFEPRQSASQSNYYENAKVWTNAAYRTHTSFIQFHQSMPKKPTVWNGAKTLSTLRKLTQPGVVGFYQSVEITEIIGVKGKTSFTNFLTLAVAEPAVASVESDGNPILLNGKEWHKLADTDFNVAIARYRLPLGVFLEKVAQFGTTGLWRPSKFELQTGTLSAVPPQFVPSDSGGHHPWNGVLKNNFFGGSQVLELFDTTKPHVRFLLDESRRLTNLVEIVGKYLPIRLDGLSDRLGNVIIQLPVTVISTNVRRSPDGEHFVKVAWHPDVEPRPVHISAEIWQDSTVTAYDAERMSEGEARLQISSLPGGARMHVWDEQNRVLLGATPPVTFFTSASISVRIDHKGDKRLTREFLSADLTGQSLQLVMPMARGRIVGSGPETPREPWVSRRLFGESVATLKAKKEFVQYGIDEVKRQKTSTQPVAKDSAIAIENADSEGINPATVSTKQAWRAAALEDIKYLMKMHGQEGVWLWDPFLSADDVLRTLFFCPHDGVPLRAITAGKTPISPSHKRSDDEPSTLPSRLAYALYCYLKPKLSEQQRQQLATERAEREKQRQTDYLEARKGNCLGLDLEFRIRSGGAGWGFHDRFIIFPRAQDSALAWSLGTSINSFGDEHHILQKVSHGEPIAQAFQDLWEQLEDSEFLIWKAQKDEKENQ